ncbi:hypothetical protein C8R43DRAFT_1139606 [Mycena crocata]|nr:hypothetical protein C8R43DRAFT_1139606 [Mycena crocata]
MSADERLVIAIENLQKGQEDHADKYILITAVTVADEYDKEFYGKYSTDLDSSLIFAGLFSAVDSTFIVQIQPQIQPHGTPHLIVVAQSLLYFSLGAALLAALLAVLGERGTLEARCVERQRKFDNIQKWNLEIILQTFPLLLQIALLLFLAALTVYLWEIRRSIAIVLVVTSFGFLSQILFVLSAIISRDSPFQTSITQFMFRALLPTSKNIVASMQDRPQQAYHLDSVHPLISAVVMLLAQLIRVAVTLLAKNKPIQTTPGRKAKADCGTTLDILRSLLRSLLPNVRLWVEHEPFWHRILEPSPELPAIAWLLETSTDPDSTPDSLGARSTDLFVDRRPLTVDRGP